MDALWIDGLNQGFPTLGATDWFGTGLQNRRWAKASELSFNLYLQPLLILSSHHPQIRLSSCRKASSGLPLSLHYGELCDYLIRYHSVIIIETACTKNVMHSNHPQTIPSLVWKNCFPWNGSLVPKTLGTAGLHDGKPGKEEKLATPSFSSWISGKSSL